jgi:hypothetical protein
MKPKADVKDAADALRELKNWIYQFAKEYDLSENALEVLHKKIDEVANKLAGVECK